MSSLVVDVTVVDAVSSHANSDHLELAKIKGWQVVVKKREYRPGDKVVFFPPQTVLPEEVAARLGVTKYLAPGGRIHSIRLRGEPSFGMAVKPDDPDWPVGMDVAAWYGAQKYIPPPQMLGDDGEEGHIHFESYTEIQDLRTYPTLLEPGEQVLIFEKMDGCLAYRVRVAMADGTSKRIAEVKVGEYVLGVDTTRKVVQTRVLRTFNNKKLERRLTITGKRLSAGRGNHFWAVHCTPNHRFWSPERKEYIPAETLREGDCVLLLRHGLGLTPIQEQVLIGKMLGDGFLALNEQGAAIHFGHRKEHEGYVDWTLQALGNLASGKRERTSGFGTAMVDGHTVQSIHIKEYFAGWVDPNGVKRIPESIVTQLGPLHLPFGIWMMGT